MPRFAAKVDLMQGPIVDELRQLGFSVEPRTAAVGKGFPDIIVGKFNINIIVEIKNNEKGKLTKDEVIWHDNWEGQVLVGWNVQMIIREFIKSYFRAIANFEHDIRWLLERLEIAN